jgi:cytochrome P450
MHQHIQTKLRKEVMSTPDDISYEELMRLPYLDAFVRELLRVDAPVPEIYREAVEDDLIPTSVPSYNAMGTLVDSVPVQKGQAIVLPLLEINRSKAIWGPTACEFDPERWLDDNLPPTAEAIHSFNHIVTFADGYVTVVKLFWIFLVNLSRPRTCLGKNFGRSTYFHPNDMLTLRCSHC